MDGQVTFPPCWVPQTQTKVKDTFAYNDPPDDDDDDVGDDAQLPRSFGFKFWTPPNFLIDCS